MRPNYAQENDDDQPTRVRYAPPQAGGVTVPVGGGMPMMTPGIMPGDVIQPGAPPGGDFTPLPPDAPIDPGWETMPPLGDKSQPKPGAPPDVTALIQEMMNRQAPRGGGGASPVARLLGAGGRLR